MTKKNFLEGVYQVFGDVNCYGIFKTDFIRIIKDPTIIPNIYIGNQDIFILKQLNHLSLIISYYSQRFEEIEENNEEFLPTYTELFNVLNSSFEDD